MAYARKRSTRRASSRYQRSSVRRTSNRRTVRRRKSSMSGRSRQRPITVRIVMQGVPAAGAPASTGQKAMVPVRAQF